VPAPSVRRQLRRWLRSAPAGRRPRPDIFRGLPSLGPLSYRRGHPRGSRECGKWLDAGRTQYRYRGLADVFQFRRDLALSSCLN
jgi:hypothetical protein